MSDLTIVLLQCPEYSSQIEEEYSQIFQVQSLKELVRVLIEKSVDLIVLPKEYKALEKIGKVFKTYNVPFLCVGSVNLERTIQNNNFIKIISKSTDILPAILDYRPQIMMLRTQRENEKVKFLIEKLVHFSDKVIQTEREQFISEVKSYFTDSFKMESCHWIEVKSGTSKLPPILRLRQGLEKLKIDQGGLLSDLENYSSELVRKNNFQIWKNAGNEFLVMIWMPQELNVSQCIVLNKLQTPNQRNFQELLDNLHSFLQRRWGICLQVVEARKQVYKDSLTNLYNQKFLNETLAKKIEEYRRYNTPFSILFIDIDHFKRVNDSLGHLVGSGVLKELGELLMRQIRNSDYAFRYGGDEFIVLLSHTDGDDAVNVAERIRKEVELFPFKQHGVQVRITVSIGLAFYPKHAHSADEIIRIADEAMYYGKNKSRNIVYKAS